MAVATKESSQDTEAQEKLRAAVNAINKELRSPTTAELTQARDDLDRYWVPVARELQRLAMPLTRSAPDIMASTPGEPSPERLAQLRAIDYAAALLESARHARGQANAALYRLQ